MNIDQAIVFSEEKISQGNKSDGCTLVPDFGIKKWCVMHDMLRRFAPVSAFEADNLYFKGIWSEGLWYWPVACIYWSGVRLQSWLGTGGAASAIALTAIVLAALIYSD